MVLISRINYLAIPMCYHIVTDLTALKFVCCSQAAHEILVHHRANVPGIAN